MLQAIFILGGDEDNFNLLPSELREATLQMIERIRNLLEFYHLHGVGESYKDLLSLVYWEARIILEMVKMDSDMVLKLQSTQPESC